MENFCGNYSFEDTMPTHNIYRSKDIQNISTKVQHGKPMCLFRLHTYSSFEETMPGISQKVLLHKIGDNSPKLQSYNCMHDVHIVLKIIEHQPGTQNSQSSLISASVQYFYNFERASCLYFSVSRNSLGYLIP